MPEADHPAPGTPRGATSATVVRGGLWTVLSRVLPQLQLVALSLVAARYLGPVGLGRQSFIAFVALSLVQVATGGLPPALNRFVAELLSARRAGSALGLFVWTRRALGAAAAIAAGSLLVVALLGAAPQWASVLAGVGAAFAVLQAAPAALLLGAQHWRQATVPSLTTGVASVPAAAVVLGAGGGITGLFAVEAVLLGSTLCGFGCWRTG